VIGGRPRMGQMQALELVKDRKTKEPAPEAATQLMERARQNGLLIGKGGSTETPSHGSHAEHHQPTSTKPSSS